MIRVVFAGLVEGACFRAPPRDLGGFYMATGFRGFGTSGCFGGWGFRVYIGSLSLEPEG